MNSLDHQVGGDHYKRFGIQPAEYSHANQLGWHEGEVVKYITRWKHKGGLQDLEKAQHCVQMLIDLETQYIEDTRAHE